MGKQELGLVSDPSTKGHEIPPLFLHIYTTLRASFRPWVLFRLKVRHSCNFAYFVCVQRPDQDITEPHLINKAFLFYSQYPDCNFIFLLVLCLLAGNRPSWSSYFIFSGSGFRLRVLLSLSCISFHVTMCIAFAYVFISCIRAFSPLFVLHSGAPTSYGVPFCLFSCAGVKRSRIGPRLAKRPWFTTGRPPVQFRAIWSPFDTPTVNRVTLKASFVCSPTPHHNSP